MPSGTARDGRRFLSHMGPPPVGDRLPTPLVHQDGGTDGVQPVLKEAEVVPAPKQRTALQQLSLDHRASRATITPVSGTCARRPTPRLVVPQSDPRPVRVPYGTGIARRSALGTGVQVAAAAATSSKAPWRCCARHAILNTSPLELAAQDRGPTFKAHHPAGHCRRARPPGRR